MFVTNCCDNKFKQSASFRITDDSTALFALELKLAPSSSGAFEKSVGLKAVKSVH